MPANSKVQGEDGVELASGAPMSSSTSYRMLPSAPGAGDRASVGGGPAPRAPVDVFTNGHKSPIDLGFPNVEDFPRGDIEYRQGYGELDLTSLQQPMTFGHKMCAGLSTVLIGGTGVGLFYLAGKATLVRRGEIGIVEHLDGSIRVLDTGFHLLETVGTRAVRKAHLADDTVSHGALKMIRILPGHVGLATANGRPIILLPGRHLITDPLFMYFRAEPQATPHINVGTTHLIVVQSGQVGLATVGATAHFLEPGRHAINNPTFAFLGFKPSTSEVISVGSKHRVCVPAGKIGLAWERGAPILLETGTIHNIDSPYFAYAGSRFITEPVIQHGSLTLVTVKQGFAGVSFDDGNLVILESGRHVLSKATHFFSGFLSLGQTVLSITEISSMTSDNLQIRFDAAIAVRIVDVSKAVKSLCNTDGDSNAVSVKSLWKTVVDRAKLNLSIIIGNNRLNSAARVEPHLLPVHTANAASVVPSAALGGAGAAPPSAPEKHQQQEEPSSGDPEDAAAHSFKQRIHDVFLQAFHTSMLTQCGVEVVDMSVEDVTIVDKDLAGAMAQGAVARTNLMKAQIEMEVMRSKAQADQAAEVIRAEGRARATAILADAEANRIRKLDDAMSRVSGVMAQRELIKAAGETLGETKSSIILAHSMADVTSLLGSGGVLASNKLGVRLAGSGEAPQ